MAKRLLLFILMLPVVFQTGCYMFTRSSYPEIKTIKQRLSDAKLPYKVAVNRGEYAELLDGIKAFASCKHRPHFEGLNENGNEFFLCTYPLSAEQAPGGFNSFFIPYNWVFGISNFFSLGFGLPAALKIHVRVAMSVQDVEGNQLKKYVSEHDEKYFGWVVFVGFAYWKQKIEPGLFLDCVDRFASDLKKGKFDDYLVELKEDRKQLVADRVKREKEAADRLRQQYKGPTKAAAAPAEKVKTEPEKTGPVKETPKKSEPPKKEEAKPILESKDPKMEKSAPPPAGPKKASPPAKSAEPPRTPPPSKSTEPAKTPPPPKKSEPEKKTPPPLKEDEPEEPAPPPPPDPGK